MVPLFSQASSSLQPFGPLGSRSFIPAWSKPLTTSAQAGNPFGERASAAARSYPSARAARMDQDTGPSTKANRFDGSKNQRDLSSVFITARTSNWFDWIIEATSERSVEVKRAVTKCTSRRFAR